MGEGKQSNKYTVSLTDEVHEQAVELLLIEGFESISQLTSSLIRKRHHELQQKRFAMQLLSDSAKRE